MCVRNLTLLLFLLITSATTQGQKVFTIGGIVTDSIGPRLSAATVFLDGSQRKTITNQQGAFSFSGISPGTYKLIVHFVGYQTSSQTIIVQDEPIMTRIVMNQKPIILKEVIIGNDRIRAKQMKLFVKNFLGESRNARKCKILNPDIIEFSTKSTVLEATTEDFLIIENSSLGYRIKYLLRSFRFNHATAIASYDGECIYEEMEGSEDQLQTWKSNRRSAYEGSFMHYLRALYKQQAPKEGFLTYLVKGIGMPYLPIDPTPVSADQITRHSDSTFMELKFPERIYALFDKRKSLKPSKTITNDLTSTTLGRTGSLVKLFVDKAIVDSRGSYVDYKSFLLQGYWGKRRVGDQLPFEYQP